MNRQDSDEGVLDFTPVLGPQDTCKAPVVPPDRVTSVVVGASAGDPASETLAPAQRYEVRNGRFCHVGLDRKGQKVIAWLSNFAAKIEEEITYDDGAELRREFRISGRLDTGEELPVARVGASVLGGMGWVLREWGARAVVFAGHGVRDHLRTAIQALSRPSRRRVYRHTGWIGHDGQSAFLFHGGAVGVTGIEVELPPPLDRFRLPDAAVDAADAVRWSLRLIDCGPPELTVPILAAVYVAPLSSILNPDTAIWLYGRSGSLKSTLSSLAQSHFGSFDHKTLSASWTATDNALLDRLHVLKDVLSVIDDYAPQADSRARSELDRRVQRVLRDVGNRAARSRLSGDLQQRPDHPPRGFLLCNGEMLPPGHSINARLVHVEVDRARLDLDAITKVQANADRLPHAMRAYVSWLAPQLAELKDNLSRVRNEVRATFQQNGLHLRQPEALSNLYVGIDLFATFAVALGVVSLAAANGLRTTAMTALKTLAFRQAQNLGTLDPADAFVGALTLLLREGGARLVDFRAVFPADDPDVIGWRRGDLALLIPERACRRVTLSIKKAGGEGGDYSGRAIHRMLVEHHLLMSTADGRNAGQWRVGPDHRKQRGWLMFLGGILPGSFIGLASPRPPLVSVDDRARGNSLPRSAGAPPLVVPMPKTG